MASGTTVSTQNAQHIAQHPINGPVIMIMVIIIIRSSNSKEVKIYWCCGFVMKQICSVISKYSQCIPWARRHVWHGEFREEEAGLSSRHSLHVLCGGGRDA